MPKAKPAKKMTTAPPPPAPATAAPPAPVRAVIHDRVKVVEYSTATDVGPLTPDDLKGLLKWETEPEWQARMVREKGGKPEHYLFGEDGPRRDDTGQVQPIHCRDTAGHKVVCWSNAGNRPFDGGWCEELIHTALSGQWAGPLMMPGETVNGETIRISRYGRVLSAQHSATAHIIADEHLQAERGRKDYDAAHPKYPAWNGHQHVVMETLVVTGISEDERVLRTIDYVKPRTMADVLYTMPLFRERAPVERREMTRMLSAAIDVLWDRTEAQGYKTHPEVVGFLERHRRLLQCVEHLFTANGGRRDGTGTVATHRAISSLRLSAGGCAALCYLMGCGTDKTTDIADAQYRNAMPPDERVLDWGLWDRAREFWQRLAAGADFLSIRVALGRLKDSSPGDEANRGQGGRAGEKYAILSKAWERWRDHPASAGAPFDLNDLRPAGAAAVDAAGQPTGEALTEDGLLWLHYSDKDDKGRALPDGQVKLLDQADFLGIDCPEVGAGVPEAPDTSAIWGDASGPGLAEKMRADAAARRAAPAKR